MPTTVEGKSSTLDYASAPRTLPWKRGVLGVASMLLVYILVYFILRLTGVYHLFYNQGGWEMDGGTNISFVDGCYVPMVFIEQDLQNRLRWTEEPTGP